MFLFIRLVLIFTLVPLIELALLIELSQYFGIMPTIILVAGTGLIGVSIARRQGYSVVNGIKTKLRQGIMPADDLIGGLLILIGGAMLLTPGLLTDLTGFLLILPLTRKFFAKIVKDKFMIYIQNINVSYKTGPENSYNFYEDDYIDIETEKKRDD
ncbi:MAG: FxsA family protein [Halanaerobiaceae bacterium]